VILDCGGRISGKYSYHLKRIKKNKNEKVKKY
jgi:hypothetical protein